MSEAFKILECVYGDNVDFVWNEFSHDLPIEYVFKIFDDDGPIPPAKIVGENKIQLKSPDDLKIGKSYRFEVGWKLQDEELSDQTQHLLYAQETSAVVGGWYIPRNVIASKNRHNPVRFVDVSFTPPYRRQENLLHYEVSAKQDGRQTRLVKTNQTSLTMKHLKSDTKYCFTVRAVFSEHGDETQPESFSDYIVTDCKSDGGPAGLINFQNVSNVQLRMGDTQLTGLVAQKKRRIEVDASVRNFQVYVEEVDGPTCQIRAEWDSPTMTGDMDDYFILAFILEVKELSTKKRIIGPTEVIFEGDKISYASDLLSLQCGKKYTICVKIRFQDIDSEGQFFSTNEEVSFEFAQGEEQRFLETNSITSVLNPIKVVSSVTPLQK